MYEFIAVLLMMVLITSWWGQNNTTVANDTTSGDNKTLFIGAFFNLNIQEGWSTLAMAQMAIEEINNNTELLPEHKLQLVVQSTQGSLGYGHNVFHKFMNDGKKKIMLLGPDDDILAKSIASYASHPQYRLLQFSSGTTSLDLANYRNLFPYFFRTKTSLSYFDLPQITILKHFGWEKVGLIYGDRLIYYQLAQQFKARLQGNQLTMLADVRLQLSDPARPVRTMMSKDVHVILGLFDYDSTARKMFCEAYKRGMYGPHYVWILTMSDNGWWVPGSGENLECSAFEMTCQLQNHLFLRGTYELPDGLKLNQAGKNYSTIINDYYEHVDSGNVTSNRSGVYEAFQMYDAVYSIANVLHNARSALKEKKSDLERVQYGDKNISELFYNETLKLNFFSPYLGSVRFFSNGDRKYDIDLFQMTINTDGRTAGKRRGVFDVTALSFKSATWSNFEWLAGVPYKKTNESYHYPKINPALFAIMTLLACLGLLYALLCFAVVAMHLNDSFIKKSGPVVNLFIIIGCILNYITVILYGLDYGFVSSSTVTNLCRARAWTFAIGFTLSVGGLFAKLWIAYCVLSQRFVKKETAVLAWNLMILLVLFVADIVIMSCWEAMNPLYRTLLRYRDQPQYKCGDEPIAADVFQANIDVVEHCVCTNLSSWLVLVLIVKGIVVLFGTFMAWQTRKIYIRALNDTQHCAICMMTICVCSILGLIFAFTLARYPSIYYGLIGFLILLCTTIILLWLFIYKILRVQCKPRRVKTIHVGGKSNKSCCDSCGGGCAGPIACLFSWCCCLPCCNPHRCCVSSCCGTQVYPDRSQHQNEVDFYIAGKGQDKDAEIVLLKHAIEAKEEELKLLRSKHGTVSQAATQTENVGDPYDSYHGNGNLGDLEEGSENSRNGYKRDPNKFKIFNQRLDFSHVQSKIDTGVTKSPSSSHRRKTSNEYKMSDPVRRNSRLLSTNSIARQDEEISKLKLILAQKENEIQRLRKNLDSLPPSETSLKHFQGHTTSNPQIKKEVEDNIKKLTGETSKQLEETQFKEKNSGSPENIILIPEGEMVPATEDANAKSVSGTTNIQSSTDSQIKNKITEENTLSSDVKRDTSKDSPDENYITDTPGNMQQQGSDTQHDWYKNDNGFIPVEDKPTVEESKNASWLGLKDSPFTQNETANTKTNPMARFEATNKIVEENAGRVTSEDKQGKDDLYSKEDQEDNTLPLNSTTLDRKRYPPRSREDNNIGVQENRGEGRSKDSDLCSKEDPKTSIFPSGSATLDQDVVAIPDDNNVEDDNKEYGGNDDADDFYDDIEGNGESEEEEEFCIETIDEEREDGHEECFEEQDSNENSDSNRNTNPALRRRKVKIPGGKLNWKAESRVNSMNVYKPRRSQKKIKTYKVDYSKAKSRLYSSSSKIDGIQDDTKIEPNTNFRTRKTLSNSEQSNVRPKLYGRSVSLSQNGDKPTKY